MGDGYNGRYHFRPFGFGWCLRGDGSDDYLTPGIGVPIGMDTPDNLLDLIAKRRPKIKIKIIPYEPDDTPKVMQ